MAVTFTDVDGLDPTLNDSGTNATKAGNALVKDMYLKDVTITNTGGSAALAYLKIWDEYSGNVTVGTTNPTFILMIPAAFSGTIPIKCWDKDGNLLPGFRITKALTWACVTTGGTAGTSNPADTVTALFGLARKAA